MRKQLLILLVCSTFAMMHNLFAQKSGNQVAREYTQSLMQSKCNFLSTGENEYFILKPGYQLILEGKEGKDSSRLVITVLNETKKIGNVETRIVEERETVNGVIEEVSRNYFAFCQQTGSIYYFGEDVDNYKNGKLENHSGSWLAETVNNAGLAMPGLTLVGARYYQEIAKGIAMDRAEIISKTDSMKTPAGVFNNVLKTLETTPLEPKEKEYKYYAPGIGLIADEGLRLTKYGYITK